MLIWAKSYCNALQADIQASACPHKLSQPLSEEALRDKDLKQNKAHRVVARLVSAGTDYVLDDDVSKKQAETDLPKLLEGVWNPTLNKFCGGGGGVRWMAGNVYATCDDACAPCHTELTWVLQRVADGLTLILCLHVDVLGRRLELDVSMSQMAQWFQVVNHQYYLPSQAFLTILEGKGIKQWPPGKRKLPECKTTRSPCARSPTQVCSKLQSSHVHSPKDSDSALRHYSM